MNCLYLFLALSLALLTSHKLGAVTSSAEILQRQNAAILETLQSSEAEVSGNFKINRDIPLMSSTVKGVIPVHLTFQQNKDLLFSVNENSVSLTGRTVLKLKVGGLNFYINNISFDEKNGFNVSMDSPLWWNLGGKEVADEVKRILEEKYGERMKRALRELRGLRQQRNLRDANRLVSQVLKIFTDNNSHAPDLKNAAITGNVGVKITATQGKDFDLGEAQLVISPGSSLSTDTSFRLMNNSLTITEISLNAENINVYPTGRDPNGSARVTGAHITLSARGLETIFDSPAETEVLQITAVIGWLAAVTTTGNAGVGVVCPPSTRVQFIQDMISERVRPQLKAMIRDHRAEFLRAGIDPEILNALD